MRLGIMQPYFLPYIGYFSLIKHTDEFILFDPVQFIHHGWIERNRILKQTGGWQYIAVPLIKHARDTIIRDIQIDNNQNWKQRILAQLVHYRKAPYYYSTIRILNDVFEHDYCSITELDRSLLISICKYLSIERTFPIFSEMNLIMRKPLAPDEWALNICEALGDVDEYWNPPSGISFFNREKYKKANIKLCFLESELTPYKQKSNEFEPWLSIIDVMMFNSVENINSMLDKYVLL